MLYYFCSLTLLYVVNVDFVDPVVSFRSGNLSMANRSAVKSDPAVSHHLQIFKEPYGFSPYARVYSKRHANFQKKRKKSEKFFF